MTSDFRSRPSAWTAFLETTVHRACVLEAAAAKPGNVHPHASFVDTTYDDFVRSAEIVAPILARTTPTTVGQSIFEAVTATRESLGRNTNLGIILLIAPLCAVPESQSLAEGIEPVLEGLTREDAVWVYRAIRLAQPGGLGDADAGDVAEEPTGNLRDMMALAGDRDSIAREYAEGFPIVLKTVDTHWRECTPFVEQWNVAIVTLHLKLMAAHLDTLIARKCGIDVAATSAAKAKEIVDVGGISSAQGKSLLQEFDAWLRADGNRRNPGTTADLIAAAIFAAARERVIELPDPATIRQDIARRNSPP